MLAGILIAILVVGGIALALPWVMSQRAPEGELDGDPTQRFSNSIRILHRDLEDMRDDELSDTVSTPLTRRAGLREITLIARQAARRRLIVMAALVVAGLLLVGLSALGTVSWWTTAIPGGLLLAFIVVARFSVVAMHKNLDVRAEALAGGFDEQEDTAVIALGDDEASESIEISVDLSMPTTSGALWDPIPVTPATYVSQPLLPRTVRTIDLSAPVVADSPVPTADNPESPAEEVAEATSNNVTEFRPRAIGE